MNIYVITIPHNTQRYDTCGDWWFEADDNLQIRVSDLGNINYEWFIAGHEINEALLCKKSGIEEKEVMNYDLDFEKLRERFPQIIGDQEPGNMIAAPYNKQHEAATRIEALTCKEFGEDWNVYDESVVKL